jgi:hypothetical protein
LSPGTNEGSAVFVKQNARAGIHIYLAIKFMLLSSINLIGATALIAKHANNYSPQKNDRPTSYFRKYPYSLNTIIKSLTKYHNP